MLKTLWKCLNTYKWLSIALKQNKKHYFTAIGWLVGWLVYLMFIGTSALFRLLVPRTVEINRCQKRCTIAQCRIVRKYISISLSSLKFKMVWTVTRLCWLRLHLGWTTSITSKNQPCKVRGHSKLCKFLISLLIFVERRVLIVKVKVKFVLYLI